MYEYILIGSKTILFLIIILVIIRVMGKRELGELNVFDIIVSFMISELFSNAISDPHSSIGLTIFPIIIIFIVQVIISFIVLKSYRIRKIIESEPVIIINNGIINYNEMKKQRYNTSDLLLQIREKGIYDISKINYAILEVNGSLSIFTKEESIYKYPFPLINDGELDNNVRKYLKLDHEFVYEELKNNGYESLDDVFLGFLGIDDHIIFFSKEHNYLNNEKGN